MAQQKSEDRVVPEGGVMPAEPVGSSPGGQGKAVPVEETAVQLCLPIATAEVAHASPRAMGVPKAIVNARTGPSVTMEEVASRLTALLKVVSNKGAPGPDGVTVEALRERWPVVLPGLHRDLLEGRWRPGEIRRALIPKADGGQRGLGIPNVVDRVVMEAVQAGARACLGADVSRVQPRVSTWPQLPHGDRRGQAVSRKRATSGWWTSIWRSSSIGSAISGCCPSSRSGTWIGGCSC